jgi:AP-1 complex subunit gamma-1
LGSSSLPASSATPALKDHILGDIFGTSKPAVDADLLSGAPALVPSPASTASKPQAFDPLVDLLQPAAGAKAPASSNPLGNLLQPASKPQDPLAGLMGGSTLSAPSTGSMSHTCYNNKGLRIDLNAKKESPMLTQVVAVFSATGGSEVSGISLQVAVPKTLKLQIFPPDSMTASPVKAASQTMNIENPSKVLVSFSLMLLS